MNGYFTVTEYPVIEALRHGGYRTATDLDILIFMRQHNCVTPELFTYL